MPQNIIKNRQVIKMNVIMCTNFKANFMIIFINAIITPSRKEM